MTSPCCETSGATSIDIVRYPMRSSKLRSKLNGEPGGSSYTSGMLSGLHESATLPGIDRFEIGIVNSRQSNETESFCVSLKRRWRSRSSPSTT